MTQPQNNFMNILSGLKNGNPNLIMQQMMQNNSQFKSFVEQNKGLDANQIAQKYGVDINSLKGLFK